MIYKIERKKERDKESKMIYMIERDEK